MATLAPRAKRGPLGLENLALQRESARLVLNQRPLACEASGRSRPRGGAKPFPKRNGASASSVVGGADCRSFRAIRRGFWALVPNGLTFERSGRSG